MLINTFFNSNEQPIIDVTISVDDESTIILGIFTRTNPNSPISADSSSYSTISVGHYSSTGTPMQESRSISYQLQDDSGSVNTTPMHTTTVSPTIASSPNITTSSPMVVPRTLGINARIAYMLSSRGFYASESK